MKNSTYNTGRTVTINLDNLGNAALWQIYQILTDNTGDTFYGNEEEASPAADPDAACEVFLHAAETANDRAAGADAAQRAWLQEMVAEYTEIFETNPADDLRKRLDITYSSGAAPAEEEPEADDDDADDADAIEALVGLFTGDDPAGATTPLVIPTIDFFEAHNLVNALSENEGNDAAIIAIENWLDENAAAAAEDYARRGYADLAADILEIYGGEGDDDWADVTSAIDAARRANEEPAADDDADDAATIEAEVAAWRSNPANEDLDAALKANARDTNADPNNLYRAGVFAGLAEAAAWMIYGRGICPDDINAINAAIYKAYGVAW